MNELTLEDDVVLAALDFIDTFDSDLDSDPQPTPTAAQARGAAQKRPRTTSGQRARAEIARLRGVVAELEAQVRHLKQKAYTEGAAMMDASEFREWEALVARERHERHLAQSENVQLRELLIKQMLVARKLERLVNRSRGAHESSHVTRQVAGDEGAEEAPRSAPRTGQGSTGSGRPSMGAMW